ncbi:MAG: hypothetical protein HY203_08320 [Nitrospirae bacterium]|nr:hypothetical protein [Nitrospirota bacterium]
MFNKFHNPRSVTEIEIDKNQADPDTLMHVEHTGLDLNLLLIDIMKFKPKGDLSPHRESLHRFQIQPAGTDV